MPSRLRPARLQWRAVRRRRWAASAVRAHDVREPLRSLTLLSAHHVSDIARGFVEASFHSFSSSRFSSRGIASFTWPTYAGMTLKGHRRKRNKSA
jgi:hypothetical protein